MLLGGYFGPRYMFPRAQYDRTTTPQKSWPLVQYRKLFIPITLVHNQTTVADLEIRFLIKVQIGTGVFAIFQPHMPACVTRCNIPSGHPLRQQFLRGGRCFLCSAIINFIGRLFSLRRLWVQYRKLEFYCSLRKTWFRRDIMIFSIRHKGAFEPADGKLLRLNRDKLENGSFYWCTQRRL